MRITLIVSVAIAALGCASGATPTAQDETGVAKDSAGQLACVQKGMAEHWTRAQADACTDAVKAGRPSEVFPKDGGVQ